VFLGLGGRLFRSPGQNGFNLLTAPRDKQRLGVPSGALSSCRFCAMQVSASSGRVSNSPGKGIFRGNFPPRGGSV